MTKTLFGTLADGTPVHEVVLRSPAGAEARIIEWGAVLRDLVVPHAGSRQRVVLGFPRLEDYPAHSPHAGTIAGRFANRIAGGRFTLDGKTFQMPLNQAGRHTLHGGPDGFGKCPWTIVHHDDASVTLALVSPDGDAGLPGTVNLFCRYRLVGLTLRIELAAATDAPTIINLAHHSYFKLDDAGDILDHELEIRANLLTPVDDDLIPDGSLVSVAGTPYDFRKLRPIRFAKPDGSRFWYDNNFMLRRDRNEPSAAVGLDIAHAATLRSPRNGLSMQVWTTEPALQVYDGAKIDTPVPGLDGKPYGANAGLALEPQHVPDSPNLPHFPSTVLRPGELYRQVSEYRFGV